MQGRTLRASFRGWLERAILLRLLLWHSLSQRKDLVVRDVDSRVGAKSRVELAMSACFVH